MGSHSFLRPNPQGGERRFSALLLLLVGLVASEPFLGSSRFGVRLLDVVLTSVLVAGAYSASRNRRFLLLALGTVVPTLVIVLLNNLVESRTLVVLAHVLVILFFTFTGATILGSVLSAKRITADKISGALCTYLLFGLCWAFAYSLVEYLEPGSFPFPPEGPGLEEGSGFMGRAAHSGEIYFSFTTLTTLGYGDITPQTPVARILSILEAVFGQIYLTVLVAGLVGMHVAHASHPPDRP